MKKVSELFAYLDGSIPCEYSEEWDNDGLMIGCSDKSAEKVLIVLDVNDSAVRYAVDNGFDVIVSHHPLIFSPLRSVVSDKIITLIKNDIAVFSFHTRLDNNIPGVNDALAVKLGLCGIGAEGMLRIGDLQEQMTAERFADHIRVALGAKSITSVVNHDNIRRVAVLGGSGKDYIAEAVKAGADTYVTGEVSYNALSEAKDDTAINIFTAGHYETEFPVCELLRKMIGDFDYEIVTEVGDFNNLSTIC
ncbi:MAG: Nif3-like dinuclear metal center hexameric protein [Clostridia bacterium]|nr:Nif3-like dinuclear metal center hexameric protein [Clostridia bacterium]